MFDNNFGKCGLDRFSKFFHQVIHIIRNVLLHYLVKVENPKMLLTLTAPQQTVDIFLRTL